LERTGDGPEHEDKAGMDSFEFTKIAAAVLSALLLIVGTKTFIDMNTGHGPEKPGYTLAVAEAPAADEAAAPADEAAAAEAPAQDFAALLANANAENGKGEFAKCRGCHMVQEGQPSGVGPNLWGIVNRDIAGLDGYNYSEALKAKDGTWTFEELAAFLASPRTYAPGTKMVFPGYKDPAVKADLIAYLATLANPPVELPK
jgi:cytochrome c